MNLYRTINKEPFLSQEFLNLPISTQALFFHMLVRADKKGIVDQDALMAQISGCCKEDMGLLFHRGFVEWLPKHQIRIANWESVTYHATRKKKKRPHFYLYYNEPGAMINRDVYIGD